MVKGLMRQCAHLALSGALGKCSINKAPGILIRLLSVKFTVFPLAMWCRSEISELLTAKNAVKNLCHLQNISWKLWAQIQSLNFAWQKKKKHHTKEYLLKSKARFSVTHPAPTWLKAHWEEARFIVLFWSSLLHPSNTHELEWSHFPLLGWKHNSTPGLF